AGHGRRANAGHYTHLPRACVPAPPASPLCARPRPSDPAPARAASRNASRPGARGPQPHFRAGGSGRRGRGGRGLRRPPCDAPPHLHAERPLATAAAGTGGGSPPPPAAAAAAAGLGVNKSRRLRTRAGGDGARQERPPLPGQPTPADRAPRAQARHWAPSAPRGPLPAWGHCPRPPPWCGFQSPRRFRPTWMIVTGGIAVPTAALTWPTTTTSSPRVNVGCGPAEERVLLTGLHAVADIHCENCKTTLGWKYEQAFESSQKYKEGKYIIELNHMIKDNGWD
uniref:Yippee domain-containing protein n=1 Tax=Piliocolobus tephrosceles TaxID=591936 RepID=A0A8C9HLL2_9PRIM